MFNFDPVSAIIRLIALLPALTLHEFAHAYAATRAGDPTPAAHGRVTLNPLAHLDPIGTLMILFAPIGWAKPVPINPYNFRHPARDIVRTSAAGPLSNVAQGLFWALVLRGLFAFAPGAVVGGGRATLLSTATISSSTPFHTRRRPPTSVSTTSTGWWPSSGC